MPDERQQKTERSTRSGPWQSWKRVASRVGNAQARVLLSFFYFVIFAPFALVVRWKSDPLAIKTGTPKGWQPRGNGESTLMEQAIRQS